VNGGKMKILGMLIQITLIAAATIIPALGIGERHGGAIGWSFFILLATLISIMVELREIKEAMQKMIVQKEKDKTLSDSYAAEKSRRFVETILFLKNIDENLEFIKQKLPSRFK
jgi:hypothetical protein